MEIKKTGKVEIFTYSNGSAEMTVYGLSKVDVVDLLQALVKKVLLENEKAIQNKNATVKE